MEDYYKGTLGSLISGLALREDFEEEKMRFSLFNLHS
jgi:hypothetical protein